MKALQNRKESGFTIIEVVLVLAIAGLIFLVVFLALPQLQESRRDTQRRSDVSRALAALETYAGSNNGDYPADAGELAEYLPDEFEDPSGGDYTFVDATPAQEGEMRYQQGAVCDGDEASTTDADGDPAGDRDVAVEVFVENGKFCQDNQ